MALNVEKGDKDNVVGTCINICSVLSQLNKHKEALK